jgi:hypothetical protein
MSEQFCCSDGVVATRVLHARRKPLGLLSVLLMLAAVQACSIHFAANGDLPDTAKTIYVARFENRTRVPGINEQFTIVLKQQISHYARLVVVDDKNDADLTLSGAVLYYGTAVKTTNAVAEPFAYGDMLSVSAQLIDHTTGKILWSTPAVMSSATAPVVTQAIVPTTPQFLQQNLRGSDLVNMPDIQVAATQQATAQDRLMVETANELYTDMAWGL